MSVMAVAMMGVSAVAVAFVLVIVVMLLVMARPRRTGDALAMLVIVRMLSHLLYSTHRPDVVQPNALRCGVLHSASSARVQPEKLCPGAQLRP